MRRNKIILLLTVLLATSQLALSCGPQDQSGLSGDLVIWKPFEDEKNLRPIINAYRELNKKVKITYVKKDIATYEEELLNALASGTGPDIFSIHNDWLPRYVNKLSPAPKNLFPAREFEASFVDVAKEDLFFGEDLYAVPLSVDVLALFYNRDLLGSAGIALPPATWEAVVTAVKKITRQDRLGNFITNGIAFGTAQNINRSIDILSLLMLQNGTQVYSPTRSSATLEREIAAPDGTRYNPAVQALEFYTQFANPAKETYTWNNKNNYSVDAFVSGQVAMMLSYSYMIPVIEEKAPFLNYGIAAVPQIDLSKPRVNYANYFAEAVSRTSSNPALAWDFLKFATSAEQLKVYYQQHKLPSSRKDVISEQIADPEVGVFAEGALTAKTFYKPDASKIELAFVNMIEDVVVRGKTAAQAVSTANRVLRELLK